MVDKLKVFTNVLLPSNTVNDGADGKLYIPIFVKVNRNGKYTSQDSIEMIHDRTWHYFYYDSVKLCGLQE